MKKLLIFDFDGVIEDTFELSFGFFKKQFPDITREEYRSLFDGNFYEVAKEKGIPMKDMGAFYLQYHSALKTITTDPAITRTLLALHERFTLAIVSSSFDDSIVAYLKGNDIAGLFSDVWGVKKNTSKVEKLEELVRKYGVRKKDSFFITDTLGDIREAAVAGIPAIAVTWGFHPKERLAQGNPSAIVSTPQELFELLSKK